MNLPWACDVQDGLTRPNCIVMSLALACSSHSQDRLYPLEVSMEDSCLMTASDQRSYKPRRTDTEGILEKRVILLPL